MRYFNNRYKTPAERAAIKEANEAKKQRFTEAEERLRDVIGKVEDAFQPESDRLYASVIKRWTDARAIVKKAAGDRNTLYIMVTGHDDSGYYPYVHKGQPGRVEQDARSARHEQYTGSLEHSLLTYGHWNHNKKFETASEFAGKRAVDAERFKLRQAIVKKLMHLTQVEVKHHHIKQGHQGFEGYFTLDTNEGLLIFECFSIWVWGVVVESHARYLSYLKPPERSKAGER